MPYHIAKVKGGYKVIKTATGKAFSKKPMTKSKAEAQMRALHASGK